MGILSFFFPKPEDRVRRATKLVDNGRWAAVLDELQGIELPEAEGLRAKAKQGLVRMNLEAAISWANADDDHRVQIHLDLVEQYHQGDLVEEIRAARRQVREIRQTRDAVEQRKHEEREARLLAVDPLGISGGPDLFRDPIPDDLAGEDDHERAARLAFLVEGYPEDLRKKLKELPADFANAVLLLDEGRSDKALQTLVALPDNNPIVQYERARAAHALGDARAGARALRRFAELAGHTEIGNVHTAVRLAQMTAEAGDPADALRVLRQARRKAPRLGGILYAQLLLHSNELEEADTVLRGLIANQPRRTDLHLLLGTVRLRAGMREEAKQALEAAMDKVCDNVGRCGHNPPNPDVLRMLAILYLEDGSDVARGKELAEMLAGVEAKPSWQDRYIDALVAIRTGQPDATSLSRRALAEAPEAARAQIEKHLASPTG